MKIMKGKEWEEILLKRAKADQKEGRYTMGRYGVKASYNPRTRTWRPIKSLPDFEGVIPGGHQFILEAKVVSGPSFPINEEKTTVTQRIHLFSRYKWGALAAFFIYCPARELKRDPDQEEMTICLPCDPTLQCWRDLREKDDKASLSRDELRRDGFLIPWTTPSALARTKLPSIPAALRMMLDHRGSDAPQPS